MSELHEKKKDSELDQMFNAALPIRIIDNECKIIKVNDTFCSLFKLRREELIGKKCFEILPHEFCHTDTCSRNQILSGKEEVTYETIQYQADGTKLTLIVDSVPYRGPEGEFLGFIQNYTDITDRKKAEEQIQYQARLVEDVSDAIISTDLDFNIKSWNSAAVDIYGWKAEEAIGKNIREIIPVEYPFDTEENVLKTFFEQEFWKGEVIQHHKNGANINILTTVSVIKDLMGNPIRIVANNRDITDRKKAEESMLESEKRYKELYEDAPNAYFSIGTDKSLLKWNKAAEKLLGYTKEDFSTMKVSDLYANTENGTVKAKEVFNRFLHGEPIRDEELQMKHSNGDYIWISLSVRPVFDQKGIVIESRSMVIDISERKKAEEIITNLARFPSENPYPVLRVNKKGIIYSNKAGEDIFKIAINDQIPTILKDSTIKVLSDRILTIVEKEVDSKTYSFVITPVEGVSYVNIYGTDITERKEAEKRLEQLISTVSHELRTPITVILMSLDYLKNQKESLTPDLEERLMEGISRNTSLLHELAEDILMVSRIDEKKIELEWSDYIPSEIINEILTLLEPKYKEKNIIVHVDIDDDICLKGDSKRIDHIFRIIIDNAIKYSNEHSEIEIKAIDNYKGEYNQKEKPGVLFQFKDSGIGIPEKDIHLIFDRFFRSDHVKDIPGTGLGLSIAKDFIELHNGTIFVESDVGKGSTFFVFLPKNGSSI